MEINSYLEKKILTCKKWFLFIARVLQVIRRGISVLSTYFVVHKLRFLHR